MPDPRTLTPCRSAELLDVLGQFDSFLIVMHDNPDPDAIASGWGVETLIRERVGRPTRLIGGGAIVRAENRHMVELLHPPVELTETADAAPGEVAILVDCGPEATNHLLTRHGVTAVAVIDHHRSGAPAPRLRFSDIRPDVAASATIVASYLREQAVDPGEKLSTAMLYAIRSETRGNETHHSQLDRMILPWLTEQAEPSLLAEIENAPLARDYFGDLHTAIENTTVYGDVAFCFLPTASCAEIVGEVADLLVRCEGLTRVLCSAVIGADLVVSARTERTCGSAVELLLATVEGLGGAGGHQHRAGGKVPRASACYGTIDDLVNEVRGRWLALSGAAGARARDCCSKIG